MYKGEGKGGPNPRKGGVRDKLSLLLLLMIRFRSFCKHNDNNSPIYWILEYW